jgi:hypothetical protein
VPNAEVVINNSFNSPVFRGLLGTKKDDKGVETWDGTISKYTKEVPGETREVKGANNAIMEVTTYKTVVDRKEMEKDPVFQNQIKAISEGILNESLYGGTDLYRDVLIPAWNAQHPEKEQIEVPSDPNQKVDPKEFERLFTPFYLNHIQDYPATVEGKPKQTMRVISSGTGGSGGGGKSGGKTNTREEQIATNLSIANDGTAGDIVNPLNKNQKFVKDAEGKWVEYVKESPGAGFAAEWTEKRGKDKEWKTIDGLKQAHPELFRNLAKPGLPRKK